MAERQVSVFDGTRTLPQPFFVLATQNPVEQDGTYPLPEAQLDRFACKVFVANPAADVLAAIVRQRPDGTPPQPEAIMTDTDLVELLATIQKIVIPEAVADYIGRLVAATHATCEHAPEAIQRHVRWGASPRAALTLAACARVQAMRGGRPAAGFEDIRSVLLPVLRHRLMLTYEAGLDGVTPDMVIQQLCDNVAELPA